MPDRFTWRGIPIKDEQGNVIAVQPVRGIIAPDGLMYPGVLDHDAAGNAFTYNQVPNTGIVPVEPSRLHDSETNALFDSENYALFVRY